MGERWDRFRTSGVAGFAGGALGLAVGLGGVLLHAAHAGHAHAAAAVPGPDDHAHPPLEPPTTYDDAVRRLRALIAAMDASLAKGIDPDLHVQADHVGAIGTLMGKLAMKEGSGVARTQLKTINLAGKDLAAKAEELHVAADAGKPLDEVRSLLARVRAAAGAFPLPGDADWVCEMHCEGEKIYGAAGECPVCRMKLSKVSETPYGLVVTAAAAVLPGKPAELTLRPVDPRGRPVRELEIVHEHPLHAVIVSEDLSFYAHEHPEPKPGSPGEFLLKGLTLPAAGRYVVFGDYRPKSAATAMVNGRGPRFEFKIPGEPRTPEPLKEDYDTVKTVDGYTFRLRCNGDVFKAGEDMFLRYGIERDGAGVADLEPLMGERGHLVVIDAAADRFIHEHPLDLTDGAAAGKGALGHAGHGHDRADAALVEKARKVLFANGKATDVIFHVVFPSPGLYRAFAQFKHAGRVVTVPFTIDARPGDGSAAQPSAPGGGHAGHDHGGAKSGQGATPR